jgi:hypothetical protein
MWTASVWLGVTKAVDPSIVTSRRNLRIWVEVEVEADWPCGVYHP